VYSKGLLTTIQCFEHFLPFSLGRFVHGQRMHFWCRGLPVQHLSNLIAGNW